MKEYIIINNDQGHHFKHRVTALNKKKALKEFRSGHYGEVVSIKRIKKAKNDH